MAVAVVAVLFGETQLLILPFRSPSNSLRFFFKQPGHLFSLPGQRPSSRDGESGSLFEAYLRRLDRSPPAQEGDPETGRSFDWNIDSSFEPFGDNLGYDSRAFYNRLLGSGSLEPSVLISEQRPTARSDLQRNYTQQSPIDDMEGSIPVLFGSSPHFGRSPPTSADADVFQARAVPSPSHSLKQSFDSELNTKSTRIVVIEKLPQQVSADTIGQLCSASLSVYCTQFPLC